jgi:hypothetical protein
MRACVTLLVITGCPAGRRSLICPMLLTEPVLCPFCGQRSELDIDTSVRSQRFTTDCEVCCRPFEVVIEAEPGAVLSLDVLAG